MLQWKCGQIVTSLLCHTGQQIPAIRCICKPSNRSNHNFFPLQRALLILLLYIPEFFLQESIFPFCVFLSRENSLCPPLPHYLMTKLQRGCFGESKGNYWHEPSTIQKALRRERLLQFLLTVFIHTHQLREWKQCLTPGWTEKFLVHHTRQREPLVRSTAPLAPKEANAATSPTTTTGLCYGFCSPLVPSWRTSLVAAALPGKPDFFLSPTI